MTRSQLAALVEQTTRASVASVLARHADTVAEDMAHELLRDVEFRAEMQRLLRAAFARALADLSQPAPPAGPEASS
jgi:hypothetical protein